MPYDISQMRWSDDTTFNKPVKDETGYRLPVKIGEIAATIPITGTVEVTSDVVINAIDDGNDALLEQTSQSTLPLLQAILTELKIISALLVQGLNIPDDPTQLRNDPTYTTP